MLSFILFILIYFFLDACHDNFLIRWKFAVGKEQSLYSRLWHWTDLIIKLFIVSVFLYAVDLFSWKLIVLAGAVHFFWFDTWLNFLRGLGYNYIGTEADTDKLVRKIGISPFVLKIIVLLIAVIINVI